MKAKDEFETEDQRQAWQRGYDAVLEHRGPKTPIQRWQEETVPEATMMPIHPLTIEMIGDEIKRLPEDCQEALVAGFFIASMEQLPTGENQ